MVLSALQYGTKGSRWCSTLRHSELLSGPIVPSGVWHISFYPIYTYMYIQRHTKTPFVFTHRDLFVTGILRISKFRAAHGTFHQSNAWLLGSRVNPCLDLCLVTIYQAHVAACWLWGSCHCEVTLQLHEHCCKTWCIPTSLTDCNTWKKNKNLSTKWSIHLQLLNFTSFNLDLVGTRTQPPCPEIQRVRTWLSWCSLVEDSVPWRKAFR